MKDSCERDESTSHVTVPTASNRELVSKFRDKFLREARMIAALDHEHIVKIHDVFEENGTAYYVMEYLGGGCLGDGVKAGKAMPEGEAVESIRQIASALEYLHNKGIIHFDVKPSNVLKTEDGKLKLIDFGISKHYDEGGVQTSSTPVGISKGYAPLEQYQQGSDIKSFTPATDIYSLGATLYALLSGANPPEASLIYEDGLPFIAGISSNVMRAIEKAMQPRRKDRPQSVAEFLKLLDSPVSDDEETIIPGSAAKESEEGRTEIPSPKPSKAKKSAEKKTSKPFPKWLYGAFASIAVAIMAVVLINRSGKPEISDLQLADSTAVVAEAVAEKPVTSKPSASASKPETPAKSEALSVVELKSISLNKTALELEEGGSATLTVQYSPNNATDKSTTWKSSNTSVVKVNGNGKVTAAKAGSAAIIASCGGKDAYCNVTVEAVAEKPVTGKPSASASKPEAPAKSEAPSVVELKSISLNKTALELEEGGSATLTVHYSPNNATDKSTTWKSSNTNVAKVSDNGNVTAVKAGTATIIATCQGKIETCTVTVIASGTGTHSGHEWVDLGLSVKWATCNVGSTSPEGYGSYFAWGETSPKSDYSWTNLKYRSEGDKWDNVKFSKYVASSQYGPVDNKTTLELSDDAAHANWGGSWRMPTYAEFRELIDNCTWTWTTVNGKNGYKVVSKSNGNSIFLPAAGWRYDTSLNDAGANGDYWSSSLRESDSSYARSLGFYSGDHNTSSSRRRNGRSVRPVFR